MRKRRLMAVAGIVVLALLVTLAWLSRPAAQQARGSEAADIAAIVDGILKLQAQQAASGHRPLARGTHAKGVCAAADLEVLDVKTTVPDPATAARLARGLFATAGTYPATVRFANADSGFNADSKADVRALSFAIEPAGASPRLDFSANDRPTFPINDAHAFATTVKVVTAPSISSGFRSLPLSDKASFARTVVLGQIQKRQALRPYQQRRYWSTVPFRHGPTDVVKYSATPCTGESGGRPQSRRSRYAVEGTGPAPGQRHPYELLRLRASVPGHTGDDLLGAAPGCGFLDRECQRRVGRRAGAVSHRCAAHLEGEVTGRARNLRSVAHRRHRVPRRPRQRRSAASTAPGGRQRRPAAKRGSGSRPEGPPAGVRRAALSRGGA